MKEYYIKNTRTNTDISYIAYNNKGKILDKYINHICFWAITHGFKSGTTKLMVYKRKTLIPYKLPIVKKWVKILNDLGFPCEFNQTSVDYQFILDFKKYETRPQILSCLYLLRGLTETYICKIPDMFFKRLDENPKLDKFVLLQNCHRTVGSYANTGHMVTYNRNGKNVTLKKLFENFKNHSYASINGKGYCEVNGCWSKY